MFSPYSHVIVGLLKSTKSYFFCLFYDIAYTVKKLISLPAWCFFGDFEWFKSAANSSWRNTGTEIW